MNKNLLPLISVIIPSFNKRDLIIEAVSSLKKSTYEGRIEIIIVDDYSVDPLTKEAYLQIAQRYPEVILLESGGKGPGNARNTGLRQAQGEYVLFLDNDDLISPSFISEAYDFLNTQHDRCAYVYGDTVVFGTTLQWQPTPQFSAEKLSIANYVPVTCLYRTSALREIGGMCTTLKAMEDWDMFLLLLDKGYVGAKIPSHKKAWLFYRQEGGASVNTSIGSSRERMELRREILKRHGLYQYSSEIWNIAAVVFSWLSPLLKRKAEDRFKLLPQEIRHEMIAILEHIPRV